MNYVLDTNILLFYLKDGNTKASIEQDYDPFAAVADAVLLTSDDDFDHLHEEFFDLAKITRI